MTKLRFNLSKLNTLITRKHKFTLCRSHICKSSHYEGFKFVQKRFITQFLNVSQTYSHMHTYISLYIRTINDTMLYKVMAKYLIRSAFVTLRNGPIAKAKMWQLFTCFFLYLEMFLTLEYLINCSDLVATSAKRGSRPCTKATNIIWKKLPDTEIGSGTFIPNLTSMQPVITQVTKVASMANGRAMNATSFVGVSKTWSCRNFMKLVWKGVNSIPGVFGNNFLGFPVIQLKQR